MHRFSTALPAALKGICLAFAVAGAGAANADLVPHQAIYKLTISDKSPLSTFTGLTGAAVAVMDRTCNAWVINEQVVMRMSTVAGGYIDQELSFKARESLDGRDFVFESRSKTNGEQEEYSGTARSSPDGSSEAEFVTPNPFEMPLPDGTNFYVGLTQWLLELAKSGKGFGSTTSFDGSDDEGPQRVSAFVAPDRSEPKDLPGDPALLSGRSWRASLAFFKLDAEAAEPEFEIVLRLLENGVVTNFELKFDDLVVNQTLEDLLPAKDERCG